jgi:hypothetical protein
MEISKDQMAFDTVVTHLTLQKSRSVQTGTNRCMYRGPLGMKCAVGALIPDEEFMPKMEFKDVSDICGLPSLKDINPELLIDMQRAHDCAGNWDSSGFAAWDVLENIAESYSLVFSRVQND